MLNQEKNHESNKTKDLFLSFNEPRPKKNISYNNIDINSSSNNNIQADLNIHKSKNLLSITPKSDLMFFI